MTIKTKKIFSDFIFYVQGLSMSGADQKEAQQQLIDGMMSKYSDASQNVAVSSDTNGSIATASPSG